MAYRKEQTERLLSDLEVRPQPLHPPAKDTCTANGVMVKDWYYTDDKG